MADVAVAHPDAPSALYTCLSCTIAFYSAQDQRDHYRSDHHRYNMKRRVAGLPPVSAVLFNQKVLERKAETAIMTSPKESTCEACGKSYTTENAYRSHLSSKRHKENELRAASKARSRVAALEESDQVPTSPAAEPEAGPSTPPAIQEATPTETETSAADDVTRKLKAVALQVDEDATEEQINQTIDEKIAAARARILPTQCLFCTTGSPSLDENLTHMSAAHSFFVPDAEYLIDLVGLITYLGEKIAVGNTCIFCSGRGREFRTLEAVRKHMLDKGHCKIAYDSDEHRLEISDFYDFTTSYPDADERKARRAARAAKRAAKEAKKGEEQEDEEWEDDENVDDSEVDEIVEEEASDSSDSDLDSEDELDDNQITYGDSHYELVLPSGARIGHRSMRRYYAQSFPGRSGNAEDPNSGAALVRRLLADKNSALVPRKGGFGAYGSGTDVVKARNPGEAREAGRHVREFRDQRRREEFRTKVGFRHNSQKHYRDPLLQVLICRLRSLFIMFRT
ncbi:C2H2 type zinc-finger-domain-containing protein [Trametes gibbosa]|uniref:Zinc finger protein 212 n=1 Tax=Trametes gibbosa TaxID=160864 RepID=A0A6B9KR39_9APHY|nr:C2H2 type zinc-finger-domain-containing protein [Trametes gibbosa]QHA24585.1 zinc finger protein 212 [Trametes gibbosa]